MPDVVDREVPDAFAHLKRRASERDDRRVARLGAGVAALQANDRKITAESIKQVTRDLEPGFSGLSFLVIRRNPRAYAIHRESADAFSPSRAIDDHHTKRRRRGRSGTRRTPHSSYDSLQRLDKRDLAKRIRALQTELVAERQRRAALAYNKQTLLATILRLETELVLLRAERSRL